MPRTVLSKPDPKFSCRIPGGGGGLLNQARLVGDQCAPSSQQSLGHLFSSHLLDGPKGTRKGNEGWEGREACFQRARKPRVRYFLWLNRAAGVCAVSHFWKGIF